MSVGNIQQTVMSEDSKESESEILEWLAEHPRMMGAFFTVLMVLTQVGTVVAGEGSGQAGP